MSPGRNRHVSFPEPGDERPSALSADGLILGPLLGEDGEDMGTYDFTSLLSDGPPGLVLPLVAGFGRTVGPGGRWRRRASVHVGAETLRRATPGALLMCPNAPTTAHLPQQLALAQVLENAAAAVYGTSREGQYDLHLLRLRNLIEQATPAEIEEARSAVTDRHIEIAERLL